ncbi:MAG: efflux RND transporter permease subunit, partial [Acidobacteriota bacterium]
SFDLEGQARETRDSVSSLLNGFVYALIAIFCLLAAQFRSYAQPLIVMCAIPIGMMGAIWGHVVMGLPLTLLSLFGIVALSGIVVNDSLVLIDFINRAAASGMSAYDAVVYGGRARFRAIILTSATTVAGLAPLLIERSLQAQFLIPMAISLAFGLMAATVLTLLITPCLYLALADIKARFGLDVVREVAETA